MDANSILCNNFCTQCGLLASNWDQVTAGGLVLAWSMLDIPEQYSFLFDNMIILAGLYEEFGLKSSSVWCKINLFPLFL